MSVVEESLLAQVPSRRFGRIGWQLKPIGLGGAWLRGRDKASRLEIEQAAATVIESVRLGIDFIDTSIRYGDSELVIGCALKQLPREQWPYIGTKTQVIPADQDTADGIVRSCEDSLERLGVECLDLLQIHECECYGFDRIMGPGGALEGLRRCQTKGWCRYIGVTGRPPDLLARLVDTGEFDSVLTYFEYDLVTGAATHELLPAAQRHDVAVIAGSPARMGMFARPSDTHWERQSPAVQQARHDVERIVGQPIHELADLSIRFLLSDPRVHSIVIGSSRIESLVSAIQASVDGPLEAGLLQQLREATDTRL